MSVDSLVSEYVYHGGGLLTRMEVYKTFSRYNHLPKTGIGSADWWAFSPEAVDTNKIPRPLYESLRAIGISIMEEHGETDS